MSNQDTQSTVDGNEISFLDIIHFLQISWKKLLLASIVGAVLGFGVWSFLVDYQAELVLDNNGGIDLVSWRRLQKSLPNLADQMIVEGKVVDANLIVFKWMSDEEWWPKNVKPTYAITKADSKDLASTVGLESAGASIQSLVITGKATSKELALERVKVETNFILNGAAYLAIRSMINGMEAQVISADNDLQKKIADTQIELQYQAKRLTNLESLFKRFPAESKVSSQILDAKDSGAKYLPISTQIIAANTEINSNKEALERFKDRSQQIIILKEFLEKATPLIDGSFDGLELTNKLLSIVDALEVKTKAGDLQSLAYISGLRSSLLANRSHYTKGFVQNTAPTVNKKGMLKMTGSGLFIAFFLILLLLIGQHLWASSKSVGITLRS